MIRTDAPLLSLVRTIGVLILLAVLAVALVGCGDDAKAPTGPGSAGGGDASADEVAATLSPAELPFYDKVKDEVRALSMAIAADPGNAGLQADLGEKLLQGLLVEAGEQRLRHALEIDPGNEKAAIVLFRSRLDRGDRDDALAILRSAAAVRDSSALRAEEGRYLQMAGPDDRAAAEAAFERALELDQTNLDASFGLALMYLDDDRAAEALPLLEVVCRRRNNHLGGHYNLARALRKLGRTEDADRVAVAHRRLSHLDDLGHLGDPDAEEASIALAYMLVSGGDVDGAVAELDRAIKRHGETPALLSERAFTQVKGGRLDDGIDAFNAALKLHRNHVGILNRLAWVLATQPRDDKDRKRARVLADRAVSETDGRDVDVLDTAAVARLGVGDRAGALLAMREAVRLRPQDPALARRLAAMERGE